MERAYNTTLSGLNGHAGPNGCTGQTHKIELQNCKIIQKEVPGRLRTAFGSQINPKTDLDGQTGAQETPKGRLLGSVS
jgi:hypothetical protein